MNRAERNKILGRKRGRKPEEWKLKKNFSEKNEAGKNACSNRQAQRISITPLGLVSGFPPYSLPAFHPRSFLILPARSQNTNRSLCLTIAQIFCLKFSR
jgi:hypothetical protein